MTDSIRSPQADILDALVWGRLSQFWTKDYDPSDKEALNAVYEGALAVLDAEYVRLFEINQGKSITTVPIHSQRRWLRLDLNRHADLAAFLEFLQGDSVTGTGTGSGSSSEGDTLDCSQSNNHARHWHIQFPFTVPNGDAIARSTVELTYPTELSLVTVHKITFDAETGRRIGIRLKPGIDYTILPSGTGVRLTNTLPNDVFDFNVGFDFSADRWKELRARVVYAPGVERVSPNVILVPTSISAANLPIHAMIVRNVVDTGAGGLLETNNATFSTTYEFLPWTGDSTGPRHGAVAGQVALPPSTVLGPNDAVYIFALEKGTWDIAHRHTLATTYLNSAAIPGQSGVRTAGTTDVIDFTTLVSPGYFGSLGYLGQNLEFYLNGKILDRSEYAIRADNRAYLRVPISWSSDEFVSVGVRFSDEYQVIQQVLGDQHVHYECTLAIANPPQEFSTFDDGGDFDDDGIFDDSVAINVVYVGDVLAELSTLEVFLDGVYLNKNIDYVAVKDPDTGRIRISFTMPIQGRSIIVTYRREVRTFIYGDFATSSLGSGVTGGNRSTLSGLLTDVQGLIASFGQQYQFNAQNVGRLVEAAQVAAAGGNPFLTLFFDEYEEYIDAPIDAPNQPITSFDARNLESTNTQLISIPFLTDHVANPTVRLREGQEYDVIDGKLLSSVDLLAPRGPDDEAPGVWWCPVVFLDEQFLARNFGTLLGDIRPSSQSYQQQLQANFNLRFHGPVVQNLEWDLAIMLGSKSFQQDGVVLSTNEELIGYNVTVGNDSIQQVEFIPATSTPLSVGTEVVPTQSLTVPPIFDGTLVSLRDVNGPQIVVDQAIRGIRAGDVIRLTIYNPADGSNTPIPFASKIKSVSISLDYLIPRTTITMVDTPRYAPTTDSTMLILRQSGPPYSTVNGTVLSVDPVRRYVVRTDQEVFELEPNVRPEQRAGQKVYRGEPLFPSYALVYDDVRRPNWHYLTPDQFRLSWDYASRGLGADVEFGTIRDYRTASVVAPTTPTGYSQMTLTPPLPTPKRGTVINFTDDITGDVVKFRVVGMNGNAALVSPSVSSTKTGNVELILPTTAAATQYFEAPTPPDGASIETTLAFPQLVRSRSLQVVSTAGFPDAGKVAILLPNGGFTEFAYKAKSSGFFLDCDWPSEFPALTAKRVNPLEPGSLDPTIPGSSVLRLLSAYTTRKLNPAFLALVDARVERDINTGSGTVTMTDQNADELYALLKVGSSVFESRATTRPASVTEAVNDLTPTSSTLVSISKHNVVDFYYPKADDLVSAFHTMSLVLDPPEDIEGDINLPSGTTSVLLEATIIDPNAASPYTYLWEQAPFVDNSVNFGTPAANTTTFGPLENGNTYYVKITVTNSQQRQVTKSVRVVVAP
jgi:hypothetical protein